MTKYQIEAFGKVFTYGTLAEAKAAAEIIYAEHRAIVGIYAAKGWEIEHIEDIPAA